MSKINIVPPTTQEDEYTQNTSIIFDQTYAGLNLKKQSIRFNAELEILNGTDAITNATNVYFDSFVGAHGLFSQITVQIDNQNIETIEDYPMTVKAREVTNKYSWDFMSQAHRNNALQIGDDSLVPALMAKNKLNTEHEWTSFSVAPYISVNMSDKDISGSKGNLRITFQLNQNSKFLYGADSGTCTYKLRNVNLMYETVKGTNEKVTMPKIVVIPQNLSSSNQQYSMNPRIPCRAVSVVFHEKGKASTTNSYELETLPNLERVSFNINDLNNSYIKYDLTNMPEFLLNYQSSWQQGQQAKNMYSLSRLAEEGAGFGIGINFGDELINLGQSNFGMNVQSDVNSTRQYVASMMFHGLIVV
jgi:hypothetical protein